MQTKKTIERLRLLDPKKVKNDRIGKKALQKIFGGYDLGEVVITCSPFAGQCWECKTLLYIPLGEFGTIEMPCRKYTGYMSDTCYAADVCPEGM